MRMKIKQLKYPVPGRPSLLGQEVTVKGWVRTVRNQKTFSFVEINDGSTLSNFQVIANPNIANYEKIINSLSTGVSLAIVGTIVESPGKNQSFEMQAKSITIIGTCDPEVYPLQKKRHSFEFLRTIAHLRPRTNTLGAVARVRNALAFATHLFYQQRGFLYIHTPIITASDCEGAGKMFRATTLDPNAPPRLPDGQVDYSQDFLENLLISQFRGSSMARSMLVPCQIFILLAQLSEQKTLTLHGIWLSFG